MFETTEPFNPKEMILNNVKSKDLFDIGQSTEEFDEIDRQY